MKNYNIILLFTFVCYACMQQRQLPAINSFDTAYEIMEYDSIYSSRNDKIRLLRNMIVFGNIIIAQNVTKDNYVFSFYDINKGVFLDNWGQIGQGPDEYIQLGIDYTILDSQLVFLDIAKREINYISIPDILNKDKPLNINRESYPYTVDFRPSTINIIKDKKIATGSFKEGRFGVLDAENNIIDCPFDYPFHYEEVTGIYRGSVFQGRIKSNAEQSKFVISTFSSDIFEIYHVTDSGIVRAFVNHFNNAPQIKKRSGGNLDYVIDRNNSICGLINMAVSNNLICFSYSSKNHSEAYNSGKLSNEILCFDWNGEKIKKYILPISINDFCFDENYIYGVRDYEDEVVIYRFKM